MQLDRRKEMILKTLPERKKTSKRLKQQVLEDIYYRASSLPQKKSLHIRQISNSIPKRYSQLKGQNDESHNNQNEKFLVEQKQSFLLNERVQRKNQSLPKNFHPGQRLMHQSTQVLLPNTKKSDNQRTKIKKFAHKEQRTALTQSQQKYRLKTLQDILKKKDSKRLIRESFLHYNIKNSPVEGNPQQKIKTKDTKMMNMKHAFQNRKFTNLSKYKMSTGSRNNDLFGQNKNEDKRQSNYVSRKVSKQNSKKRIKTQHNEKMDKQFFLIQQKKNLAQQLERKIIKDLVLTDYVDSENMVEIDKIKEIITLEDSFQQAYQKLKNFKNETKFNELKQDKNLQDALKLLKNIEKQTGSLSRKTSLLLGKVNYHLGQFNNSIYYLENVFKEANYDLECIDSLKTLENEQNLWSFFSDFYFILGQSYKRTENFLCTIKILDEWELHVVKKIIQQKKNKQTFNQSKKQTISEIDSIYKYRSQMKQNTIEEDDQRDSQRIFSDLQQKKRSHSILRQNTDSYLISKIKEKQRTQSLIKKQTIKPNNQRFSLKPRAKHLSIKTLSEINVNLDTQGQNRAVHQEDLQKCSQKGFLKYGYLMRARIQFEIKNFYASIQDYQKVLACDKSNIEAGLQLATLYYKIGRKDKAVTFLQDLLKKIQQPNDNQSNSTEQIKYHLAVMLYKSQKYEQSMKLLSSMQKEGKNLDFIGQIYFYQALNLIKIKRIFSYQNHQTQKARQRQRTKNIEDILVNLQKSIDLCSSDFYIYAAYFLRIYMFIFQLKHYYGAQYEIDRLKASIDRKKLLLKKKSSLKQSQKQKIDYRIVSVEFFAKIINLDDLIQITSGIICILKLKLLKGLQLITEIQRKVKFHKSMLTSDILGIQNHQSSQANQGEQKFQANQILKLLYQFKYYGLYTMRNYRKGLGYLERIKEIDMLSDKQTKIQLRINQQRKTEGHEYFKDQSDRINYFTLQSLILIDQKKFQDALNVLRIIEMQSNQNQGKRLKTHKKTKSGNMDTISTVMQIKKQGNTVQIIKSLCYILLYKYLESQKSRQIHTKRMIQQKREIKIQNNQEDRQEGQQRNDQILLVAEDLLSQCLICDQENFQILFLISLIHYELGRYDSALNYIRQAIQLSDDHMIKHYYLKANMKLFLGKYEQAIKDYSNAITVFKEFEKQKDQNKKPFSNEQNILNKKTIGAVDDNLSFQSQSGIKNSTFTNESNILTSRSETSRQDENEYYEQEQEMHPEIYLNRAIAYLKHAYNLQYDTCHPNKVKRSQNKLESYHDVRENIINLKSAAGQDIKQYFSDLFVKLKAKSSPQSKNKLRESESLHDTIDKSPKSPNKKSQKSPNRSTLNTSKQKIPQLTKASQHLRLFLHTSDLQTMLEISKQFAKQFGSKLLSDEELMNYFYLAKQLNNCLNLMDKMIKKHYLSERTQRQENLKQNLLKKYSSSKAVEPVIQNEPYFKSRRQYKMSRANNFSEFNVQKYSTKSSNNERILQQKEIELQKTRRQYQKIQKLIIDKKILSALKDSSNNGRQDYENALVTLLQQQENIAKCYSSQVEQYNYECGDIFKYSDLVFFIGVMYYLLEDYNRCIRYFQKSYQLKKQSHQLFSLKTAVSKSLISQDDDDQFAQQSNDSGLHQLSIQNLKTFEEIYDNRIYSKEEINYNIGVAYLMARDYNSAYDYLEKYDNFVTIIENALTEINDQGDDSENRKKDKFKKQRDIGKGDMAHENSLDQISIKTKSNKQNEQDQQLTDITPFPTHNRLCSIYPAKQLNGFKFSISFCLPKMQLPNLGIFYSDEVEIARCEKGNINQNFLDSLNENQDESKLNDKTLQLLDPQSDDPIIKKLHQEKFMVKKQKIVNFLDIVTLKDIAMKPIAPWIKKDKQKKCIRFTDNFLSESFDLMTQCATQRRPKNSSRKELFGQTKDNQTQQIDYGKVNDINFKNKGTSLQRQDYQRKVHQKGNDQNPNFMKVKQKQKPTNKRYQTIEHE